MQPITIEELEYELWGPERIRVMAYYGGGHVSLKCLSWPEVDLVRIAVPALDERCHALCLAALEEALERNGIDRWAE